MFPKEKVAKRYISLENILNNDIFINDCKKRIKSIVKEGNINVLDINAILKAIVDVINEYHNIVISKQNTKFVLRTIIIKMLNDLHFLNDDNKEIVEELLNSGIELLSINIKYKSFKVKKYESGAKILSKFCFYKKSLKSENKSNDEIPNYIKNKLSIESNNINESSDEDSIRDRINSSEEYLNI